MKQCHVLLAFVGLVLPHGVIHAGEKSEPLVPVSQPVQREAADYVDFTGRTDAVTRVEMRARVSGYLTKVAFKEGSLVRQGDLLFEIDPRPYQVELDRASAVLAASEAQVKRQAANLKQSQKLETNRVIAPQEVHNNQLTLTTAEAHVRVAQAAVEAAKLNVSFTRVTAPCDGLIGRSLLAPGNLVKADGTALAEIISEDPMYVYFNIDEATLLRLRRAAKHNKLKALAEGEVRLQVGLADEQGFPHAGTLQFVDNRVNPATGTIVARGVLPNPRGPSGVRLLVPGLSVRVRLPLRESAPETTPNTGDGKPQNSELRKELLERVKKDQDARKAAMALMRERKQDDPDALRKLDEPAVKQMQQIDHANTTWLKGIVESKGWPGKSLVGTDGARAAWLLVQHADRDRPFQKHCLDLIRAAFKKGEATGEQVAYLTDRVRVGEKQQQVYGTQLRVVNGKYEPQPIEDEGRVDERRKEMGMMPLAEYLRFAEQALKGAGKKG
jgi:RND family efflux transporter MFP subunit